MKKIVFSRLMPVVLLLVVSITHASGFDDQRNNAHQYRKMIVFGDSLVDIGNLPPLLFLTPASTPGLIIPPPTRFDRGRFSNGPTIVDYLALKLRTILKVSNTGFGRFDSVGYGHGGATTYQSSITPGGFPVPGILGQIEQFFSSADETDIDYRTLIVMLAGANDYLLGTIQPAGIPPINPAVTVDNLRSGITQLYERGGRKFVVFNLPNLGQIPLCLDFNICDSLNQLTLEHNALLTDTLRNLKTEFNDISIIEIDFFSLFKRIVNKPGRFGLNGTWQTKGPASGCLLQDPITFNPENCNAIETFNTQVIFWDEQHPTTAVNKWIAKRAWRIIKKALH